MTPEFAYLLKVNVAFVLFYAFYRLFFYKDTFFKLRRAILLAFFGLALFYPLLNIQDWVRQQEPIADVIYMYSAMLPEATAKADAAASVDWYGWLLGSLGFIYWGIVAFLCGRFLVQLSSILWLAHTSERVVIHKTPVYALRKAAGPFSFFRMVFLHPESHSDKETDEILTHECTHVSQWHSIDVILSEMMCMACWFNPFVWLLKREVRHNLEYLADNTVIQSGYDSKSYQYHLLGLAHHQSVTTLYNSFNVLHLKNRIMMMNKKRSPGIVRTKYLIFIPLVGILMLLSNIEAVARLTVRLANEATVSNAMVTATGILVDETGQPLIGASVVVKGGKEGTITDRKGAFSLEVPANAILLCSYQGRESQEVLAADMTNNTHLSLSSKSREMNEQVFTVVEKMPSFPGGDAELLKYIATNIKYPKESQDNGEQGRVICSFIVGRDGSVNNPEVLRGVTPLLNEEAVRVINTMPRWNPGMQRGKAVAVKYTVPITFRLKSPVEEAKEETLTVVDVMPQYPGGDRELLKFIAQSIKYPTDAQEAGVQGRVICSFVVDKKGNIVEPKIIRGIDPSLDAEALRVIGMMPRWTPGRQDGKAVRVLYTVPITFRLQ
ncbi:TonB family protein [Parabacteroides distasonis]|uniref:TonB family protein n=2 Tax=Parabacteroides distasonis TaxID=823 RepID=UPI0018AC6A96|nr:TonB family protein [Parabacteroides distasonis]MDB9024683.1 TonB family protein [Parabacteroides distasonis]MDB9041400.1 TonB family protein [Parabacteroides distasonis]MDB9161915.1 TonB family protein [Parabacteroides distasonis]